ncbi:hypothetical protein PIROE2DRAFT_4241, partial [Piromyces sp. E2]
DSTSTLSKTTEEYKKYGNALDSNKKVVASLKRRDLTDKILLGLGLFFFLSTVVYVIGKRIWIPKILFSKKGAAAVASSMKNAVKSSKMAKTSLTTTAKLTTKTLSKTLSSLSSSTTSTTTTTLSSTVTSLSSTIASATTSLASTTEKIIKTIVDEL